MSREDTLHQQPNPKMETRWGIFRRGFVISMGRQWKEHWWRIKWILFPFTIIYIIFIYFSNYLNGR